MRAIIICRCEGAAGCREDPDWRTWLVTWSCWACSRAYNCFLTGMSWTQTAIALRLTGLVMQIVIGWYSYCKTRTIFVSERGRRIERIVNISRPILVDQLFEIYISRASDSRHGVVSDFNSSSKWDLCSLKNDKHHACGMELKTSRVNI